MKLYFHLPFNKQDSQILVPLSKKKQPGRKSIFEEVKKYIPSCELLEIDDSLILKINNKLSINIRFIRKESRDFDLSIIYNPIEESSVSPDLVMLIANHLCCVFDGKWKVSNLDDMIEPDYLMTQTVTEMVKNNENLYHRTKTRRNCPN